MTEQSKPKTGKRGVGPRAPEKTTTKDGEEREANVAREVGLHRGVK